MGFLHKLWDETLAGPPPDTGLAKLRSPPSIHNQIPITWSMPIVKINFSFKNISADPDSVPASPAGSSYPATPTFVTKKSSAEALEHDERTSPTVYDWIVISALDR